MNKAPLRSRTRTGGPGALTLAWLGFTFAVVTLAAFIQFHDWTGGDDGSVEIVLDGEPERFARPDPAAQIVTTGQQPSALAEEPSEPASLPTVRAAEPGEFSDSVTPSASVTTDETPAGAPAGADVEETLAAAGEGAAVIRIEDLPKAGEARTVAGAKPLRVAGTPPASPDPALWRQSGNGPFPQISSDGRRPARYYARTFAATEGAPRIGLIVSGLGLSRELTDTAIDTLPAEATLAFAPYARGLDEISQAARAAGHEMMVELPMEAGGVSADQLGPAGLMTSYSSEDNLKRLDWMLTRFTGYFGVTNYLGGAFSADEDAMMPVVNVLRSAGLAYVSDTALGADVSLTGVPSARTSFLISGEGSDLTAELARLEAAARENGRALAKVYVTADNLPAVAAWAGGLKDKGIALAPASALLD